MPSLAPISTSHVETFKVWRVPVASDYYSPEQKKQFGERLQTLIDARGTTQAAVGRIVGKNPNEISRYCRGKVMPLPATLRKLADHFGVTESYLVYGVDR